MIARSECRNSPEPLSHQRRSFRLAEKHLWAPVRRALPLWMHCGMIVRTGRRQRGVTIREAFS